MTLTHPTSTVAWDTWLEEHASDDAAPTHHATVDIRLEIDLAAPPWLAERSIQLHLLAALSRMDRSVLLERVDYEIDQLLPGDVRVAGMSAAVLPA